MKETRSLQFFTRPRTALQIPVGIVPDPHGGKETLVIFTVDLTLGLDANALAFVEAQQQVIDSGGRLLPRVQPTQRRKPYQRGRTA